ncbi:hypothetical protein [Sphingomonas sp.]|uniref:hypothetical protein n=1 Tax=Sphingomonas sp. TaxID=28214 RepID=UPI003341DF11
MRLGLRSVVLAFALLPVAAQAMTVEAFLAKADALKAKGLFAVGSSDITLLRQEIMTASDAYRARLAADAAAGRKPTSCPPPKGTAKIGSNDILAEFKALPPAKRNISVQTAFSAMMERRYPCK